MSEIEKCLGDIIRNVTKTVASIKSDQRGVSAVEFSFFAGLLSLGALNTADISIYIYQRMELENATQMGAQAARQTCDPGAGQLPATQNCPGLVTAVTAAVQSTSLGTKVSLQPGSPVEGYYCVSSTNTLQYVSDVTSKPANCTAAGMSSLQPGDYITIQAKFSYAPLFGGFTVANLFATPITKTATMRLD
jgi:Flp pilus assembly protein TadG